MGLGDFGVGDYGMSSDMGLGELCATEVTFSSDKSRLSPGDTTRIGWTPPRAAA